MSRIKKAIQSFLKPFIIFVGTKPRLKKGFVLIAKGLCLYPLLRRAYKRFTYGDRGSALKQEPYIFNKPIDSNHLLNFKPHELPMHIHWRVEGPFDSSYSLALVNRELARALAQIGHHVALTSNEPNFSPNTAFLNANPDLKNMYANAQEVPAQKSDVTSRNNYPPKVDDMVSPVNCIHCYAWEESGFPLSWVEHFNTYLRGITCTSSHVEKILIDNGVNVPLAVTGNGVDHWDRITADKAFSIKAKTFRFLHVSSCFPRKGVDILLQAYARSFTQADDVTLVIKTFANPHNEVHDWLADARAKQRNFPHVLIIEDDLSDSELKALYAQCHVMVVPSRAEGFGLPMAEAMLSNLAVITVGWSGQLDFCNEETAWLVDYTFTRAQSHFNLFNSIWAEPDVDHLTKIMREVYDMTPLQRNERTAKGKELLLKKFQWSDVATKLVRAARVWAEAPMKPQPKIGWMSTWNTRCGIATYSAHLIKNMHSDVTLLAARADCPTYVDGRDVIRCWDLGEAGSLDEVTPIIKAHHINMLIVQFQYGFFNLKKFSDFLSAQIAAGTKIVLVLHATIDPIDKPHESLDKLISVLPYCDRILVHTIADLNRLKTLGLVENVTLFPHGIYDYVSSPKQALSDVIEKKNIFKMASYGFLLPHKGLLELIEALALLRQSGLNIYLQMMNAQYPAIDSLVLAQEIKRKILALDLSEYVEINTDFVSDEESLAILSDADLIVFPYQKTNESASGAVRYGLASGKPVAVTPLLIFEDVADAVFTLPGFSAEEIAQGIKKLLYAIEADTEEVRVKRTENERWCRAHRYSHLGQRLFGMLQGLMNR